MKRMKIIFIALYSLICLQVLVAGTNKPIVEFLNNSAHISSDGARPGWEAGFKEKFNSNIEYIVNQLNSDLVDAKMEGESGGKANFKVEISVTLMYDCEPCTGENAVHEESFFLSLTFFETRNNYGVYQFSPDKVVNIINGESSVQETIDRTWSLFLVKFVKEGELQKIIKEVTDISDATLTFRAKNSSDQLPLKADGRKMAVLKIDQIKMGKKKFPVGDISSNPLTEFELSCENGKLIDKDGSETKKIKFTGDEYPINSGNFQFDYVVYNCDEQCEKYDDFTLKLKSQNGEDLIREIKKHKEEFECYGYTISLDYSESNDITGATIITATWECVKISFGEPGEEPVVMDLDAAMGGVALDTNGDPLLPPYTIPMDIENGLIHVSAPIKNNMPASHSLSVSPKGLLTKATNLQINFDEEYLTNPPELILVKAPVGGQETCGGIIPPGVYLEWQFDIWGNLPELGFSQLHSPAATMCPLLSNIPNSTTARVPESVIPMMKEGKAFTFTNSNDFGTYTITGIPQQQ